MSNILSSLAVTPLATFTQDWSAIAATDEYQADFTQVQSIIQTSLGNDDVLQTVSPFIYVLCHLVTIQRYYIRHFGEINDLDLTPFLDQIRAEVGFGLPLTKEIPIVEWLRENKSWYGHKTTETLYAFIASLIGSPIDVEYPRDHIFTLDGPMYLDGKVTELGGLQPWNQSKLGMIHDGVYWAQFVYVLDVLQAQNVVDITDLINLAISVHPAGTKRFIKLNYNFEAVSTPNSIPGTLDVISDWFNTGRQYPTLDNGFILDGATSNLDMHNGTFLIVSDAVVEIPYWSIDTSYRRYSHDTLTHTYYLGKPNVGFSRGIGQADGTYTTVYADNDEIVYQNVTQNVGISGYPYSVLAGLSYRELASAAYDLDGALDQDGAYPHGNLMVDELLVNISTF